ncbi:hypothetical protein ABND49_00430 [Paenibacillus larvae]|uniref:hypothetical protein n=1 Tax=Paenibacillus larvae TaxID=1464 RepID=UPI0002D5920D|nr:hypothetical protein [Paenibacillus larvae]MDV3483669.1 hypothetical protein [Paenibacillus larvae]
MLERLEHSFQAEREAKEQMRRFVADASHHGPAFTGEQVWVLALSSPLLNITEDR